MGKISSIYFRDDVEQEKTKLFLAILRSKLPSGEINEISKIRNEIEKVAKQDEKEKKPVEQPAEPKHTIMDDLDAYLGRKPSHPALQSNTSQEETVPETESRTIPHTLKPFVEQGWDLETAFRIYDEWHEEFNNFTDGKPPVKPLGERFMEERMKRDADESAE